MGCDIHLYSERKSHEDNEWYNSDYSEYDEHGAELRLAPIYDDRYYELFSMLADVRNYSAITPISEPRGLPVDISQITLMEANKWDTDGHHHSYFTLRELKKYLNENKIVKRSGYIKPEDADLLNNGVKPTSWSNGTAIVLKDWVLREWEDESPLQLLVNKLDERMRILFQIDDLSVEYPELESDFRIIFWFDN